ncbi:L-glutamine synthetase [Frankia casuarinae]|uniref:L-glutamine synthetase n=2 Tax=Frankia TaxID=1854 RepID=Q2J5N3_FRACC|nr:MULTISPECIES: glutamine synthetase family protein [Frankia]ABD13409.1 L-glutamine synthetase [Frankia casuarinae]ETA02039.1 L-glutamine synthetase [Frankia sp. CcI6]EYT91773.1 L-glutamine synthetase [Frankia casuarinae]KDA42217.1 L-glutamine synthetase [Frankia sp. BMG5.23]KEZ35762.1 L-glutamine synthetase [Frankia sp. CeD]
MTSSPVPTPPSAQVPARPDPPDPLEPPEPIGRPAPRVQPRPIGPGSSSDQALGENAAGRGVLRDLLAGAEPVEEIIVATVDLQGRLVGSAVSPEHFTGPVLADGLGACTYLHAVDVDMKTDGGYPHSPWYDGFGDLRLQPDLTTLRRAPWHPSDAVVFADAFWPDGSPVGVAPRAVLRRQLDALAASGLTAFAGTELEFLVFRESYRRAARRSYTDLTPASRYNIDYALSGTEGLDDLVRRLRRAMAGIGVAVESARGEVHPGQFEIVFRYADAMQACDNHTLYKTAAKKIAAAGGQALTFMAKYDEGEGNSCHVHLSLRGTDGACVFAPSPEGEGALVRHPGLAPPGIAPPGFPPPGSRDDIAGMSALMCSFVAGQLACMADFALLYAPNVNSYKRLAPGSFAPTGVSWGRDNRTCAIRVVGDGPGLRVEHRVPGGDANPYLAVAGMIAAGRYGIEHRLPLEPGRVGNAFTMPDVPRLPATLREAVDRWRASAVARAAFGDRVVAHLAHAAEVELAGYERTVTDWERRRGFERF